MILYDITDRSKSRSYSTFARFLDLLSFILAVSVIEMALACRHCSDSSFEFDRFPQMTSGYRI